MKKTAILLGATGLTGRYLLDMLLTSDDYQTVKVFTRKATGKTHAKLEETVCDLLKLEDYSDIFTGDAVFCCIGTTKRKTPNKQAYHDIDFGIPVTAAKLAEKNHINNFSVISAIGANKNSKLFYSRIKGEMEQAILSTSIKNILIYQPSFIFGNRKDDRFGEELGVSLINKLPLKLFNLNKYQAISGEELAQVLFVGVTHYQGHQIITRDQFIMT